MKRERRKEIREEKRREGGRERERRKKSLLETSTFPLKKATVSPFIWAR